MHKFNQLYQFMLAKDPPYSFGKLAESSTFLKKKKKYKMHFFSWTVKALQSDEGEYKYEQIQHSKDVSQAEILMKCLVLIWMSDQKI